MRHFSRQAVLWILPVMAAVLGTGCSSVPAKPAHRDGLFERWSKLDPRHGARGPSSEDVAAEGAPAQEAREHKDVSLRWPVSRVRVTSPFGQRTGEFHEGVDLHATVGTPVYASHAGTVLYAGDRIRGYGRMVVIKHSSGISTVYAHNSKLFVRRGQKVEQGDEIALSGKSGRVTAPHVHFEVRDGVAAVDPLKYLPKPTFASAEGPELTRIKRQPAVAVAPVNHRRAHRLVAHRTARHGVRLASHKVHRRHHHRHRLARAHHRHHHRRSRHSDPRVASAR